MDDFTTAVGDTVDKAITAAGDSSRVWFSTFARLVDGTAKNSSTPLTADSLAQDMARLTAAGARDVALAMQTWVAIGSAIAKVDLTGGDGGTGDGGAGDGDSGDGDSGDGYWGDGDWGDGGSAGGGGTGGGGPT